MPTPYSYDRRYPSQAERDLFAKFNRTGRASDYPTYEQWKSVYTSNNWNRDLYNRQRRIKLGETQSAENTSSSMPIGINNPYFASTLPSYPSMNGFGIRPSTGIGLSLDRYSQGNTGNAASQETTRPATNPRYSEGFMMHGDRTTASATPSPTTASQKSVLPASTTKGKTVAEIWTSVTGLPWKAAKEMGLTDGSYAQNIEILKGLKSGSITRDSIYSQIANQAVAPAEIVDLSGMQRTDDYEPVPEAAPVTESGTPYTRAMADGGFVRRYVPAW